MEYWNICDNNCVPIPLDLVCFYHGICVQLATYPYKWLCKNFVSAIHTGSLNPGLPSGGGEKWNWPS